MCGIFGYVGSRDAQAILVGGLRQLEYRGYDSAGLYIAGAGVRKSVGKVAMLQAKLADAPLYGTAGIAHTRWATHGVPSEMNAHPHSGAGEQIWLVHNGIIENWRELKEYLSAQGVTCTSQTDTEVLAKLIGTFYTGTLVTAVTQALALVRGTYGIAVMSALEPELLVVACLGSPIVLGIGTDEYLYPLIRRHCWIIQKRSSICMMVRSRRLPPLVIRWLLTVDRCKQNYQRCLIGIHHSCRKMVTHILCSKKFMKRLKSFRVRRVVG